MYSDEVVDFYRYRDAPDISSGATFLFAPDPVFFYASSDVGTYETPDTFGSNLGRVNMSAPYFLTNKGLSITLPLQDPSAHAVRPRTLTSRRWGDPQPLAMLSAHRHTADLRAPPDEFPSGLCEGVAIFLRAADRETSTYDRAAEPDEAGHESVSMFRGHLMHVVMPWDWFKRYFCDTAMFVPSSGKLQSIFAWDQAPDTAVWLLNDFKQKETLRVELFLGSGPLTYRPAHWSLFPSLLDTGAASIGAIYKLTAIYSKSKLPWGKVEVSHEAYVIVRAARNSAAKSTTPQAKLRWSCQQVSPAKPLDGKGGPSITVQDRASRALVQWKFRGVSMTLRQILNSDLFSDPATFHVGAIATEVIDLGQKKVKVHLGGTAWWITNPASSMRFLCAEMVED
ncbi:hypothetical protein QBC34DRAFT_58584 [Podospora aff. communis PSN243]|uniref:Insecticidal crystal toxin domain-containing protein n=1 Tax=Podospora aff. communis PSN243 TaxID=3040156 RepID=A0AAV9GUU7_9PEZI|nr:hypothetical protein QBC34DRAFT_58584 [Podospora aff. communis PSN243]